jgi:hypothetical protein
MGFGGDSAPQKTIASVCAYFPLLSSLCLCLRVRILKKIVDGCGWINPGDAEDTEQAQGFFNRSMNGRSCRFLAAFPGHRLLL